MNLTTTSDNYRLSFAENTLLKLFMVVFGLFWAYTLVKTPDPNNWILENILTILFLAGLSITYRKFKFSDLTYCFIFVYLMLHVYGAMYTYAENPFGYWLQDVLNLERNHYDRIVHFSFGFMLAYPMRDFFLKKMEWPTWVCWVLPAEITLSFSGMYELVEWAVADIFFPEQGAAYLGSQGDVWDAQKDMGLAFVGAILIMLIASSLKKVMK